MRRGEVWWVKFDPSVEGEIQKTRPAIIISNNGSNNALNRLQVVPLSTKVRNLFPSEVVIIFNGRRVKAIADQLTTVSKLRLRNRIGTLSAPDLHNVEQVVKKQLGLLV